MAVVLENTPLGAGMFRLAVAPDAPLTAEGGQFCMLQVDGAFLPRPISIHDLSPAGDQLRFLIHMRGEGTARMARTFTPGSAVTVSAPLGTGLVPQDAPLVLIGGGAGTAPLFYLARRWRQAFPAQPVHVYLGFAAAPFALECWDELGITPVVNVGGLITDAVVPLGGAVTFACGPAVMMRAAYDNAIARGEATDRFYISMESRMACGVGACLGCSHPTRSGNKRICKDGPVFLGEEIYDVST